ncbi:MAG: hypothetical protein LBN27_09530 [Prevotellaceae bacterium]|nr:hypothetical protein [Prevotellaceae bacterium]GHT32938.1 hypothetical protein FACS189434_05910 [Bacteroidia bacterium]
MAQVAGITVEKTYTGKPKKIIFSYNKYGDFLRDVFLEKGMEFPVKEVSPYNQTEVKRILEITKDMKAGAGKKLNMSNIWGD